MFASRISLNLSSTLKNVDLIYNGLSDKYETLYPYNQYGAENDGAMTLLTQEQLRKGEVKMVMIFISWSLLCFPMIDFSNVCFFTLFSSLEKKFLVKYRGMSSFLYNFCSNLHFILQPKYVYLKIIFSSG
jgi:hypothetical protein